MKKKIGAACKFIAILARHKYGRLVLAACVLFLVLVSWGVIHVLVQVRLVSYPPTLLFEDVRGSFLAELSPDQKRMGYWSLPDTIPPRVVECTLAAEDARFYAYPGVNPLAIVRAAYQDLRAGKIVSGASTIAMQVSRIQHPGRRTFVKKAEEAAVALLLVARYGHNGVLRQYLTIAPYGNRNRGIVYAARRYLGKPVQDLTWAEASLLAAIPNLPGRMNIHRYRGWRLALGRARWILGRLLKLGWISRRDYTQALAQLPELRLAPLETRPVSALHAILAIQGSVSSDSLHAKAVDGHIYQTTIDLDLQKEVSWLAWKAFNRYRGRGVGNLAVIVASKKDGRVLAYVGSADYMDRADKGAIDYARIPRSSGSTLKPFIYGLGLTLGDYDPSSLLTDVGLALDPKSGTYIVKDFDDSYLGPILYRNALANSRNIPAMEVLRNVGLDNTEAVAFRAFPRVHQAEIVKKPVGIVQAHVAEHFHCGDVPAVG
ncbi:MAG: transglycosylase domain-containing protein, partial [Acidobacteriota bacterium]